MEAEVASEQGYPARSYAWYAVCLFYLACVLSYVDRQIMSYLVEERKRLEVQPQIKAHWRSVPTGESYGQKWAGADMDTRRELLANARVEVILCANETVPAPEWWDPEADYQHRERLHSRVVYVRWHADEEAVQVAPDRELAAIT